MAEKAAKKKPNIFVRIGQGIVRFFKDTRGEMKRVVWPSGKQVRTNLAIVLLFVVLMATLIFLLDLGFSWLFKLTMDLSETIRTGMQESVLPSSSAVNAAVSVFNPFI